MPYVKLFYLRLVSLLFVLFHIVLGEVVAFSVYYGRHLHRAAASTFLIVLLDGVDKEFIVSNFVPLFYQ